MYQITQANPNFIRIDNLELQINKHKDVTDMIKTKHVDKSNLFLNHIFILSYNWRDGVIFYNN